MKFKRLSHFSEEVPSEPMFENMLGFQVYDCFGSFVGVVEDLLADADDPKMVNYILISQGHVPEILHGKDLIVPFDRLDINKETREASIPASLDQLREFPTYDTLQDPDLKDKVDSFWAAIRRPMAA